MPIYRVSEIIKDIEKKRIVPEDIKQYLMDWYEVSGMYATDREKAYSILDGLIMGLELMRHKKSLVDKIVDNINK